MKEFKKLQKTRCPNAVSIKYDNRRLTVIEESEQDRYTLQMVRVVSDDEYMFIDIDKPRKNLHVTHIFMSEETARILLDALMDTFKVSKP